jgi:cardiolipin synthase A/B
MRKGEDAKIEQIVRDQGRAPITGLASAPAADPGYGEEPPCADPFNSQKRASMNHTNPTSSEQAELPSVPFITHGSYPRRAGNRLRPLIDSGPAFRRICEAVDHAQHSVWLTVAFIAMDFQMPDGRGTLFDVLDCAVKRGLDVRLIFWRPNPESSRYGRTFAGTPSEFVLLAERGSRFGVRWDRAPAAYCHHQKCWLIDAGHDSETTFIGGINLTSGIVEPGHMGGGQRHDAYLEVTGPCASDIHHNFVQRWNEASERDAADGAYGDNGRTMLDFPTRSSKVQGHSVVQIQRNLHAGCYTNTHAAPEGTPFPVANGENAITEQYLLAIQAARRSIYLENQALPVPAIASALADALRRGVRVVLLVPGEPEPYLAQWRQHPERQAFFESIEALGKYEHFALTGIAGRTPTCERLYVYVHAKLMLVDDAWATIGSCNLHSNSLYGHSELNAAIWDPDAVRALRRQLFLEHLGQDTSHLDDAAAIQLYQCISRQNEANWRDGNTDWAGLACSLNPQTYGTTPLARRTFEQRSSSID